MGTSWPLNQPPLGFYSPNENTDRHSRQTQDSIWELPELSLHRALHIAYRSLRQNGTNQNFKTRFWGGHSNGFGLLFSQSIYFSWTLQCISDKSRACKKRRDLCFLKEIAAYMKMSPQIVSGQHALGILSAFHMFSVSINCSVQSFVHHMACQSLHLISCTCPASFFLR